MKHLFKAALLVAFVFTTICGSAQISEGVVNYDIKIDSDDPMVQQQSAMMAGSTMKMSFQENNFRQEMDMKMMKTTTVYNGKDEKSIILLDLMGMKKAAKLEDLEEAAGGSQSDSADIEYTDETKKIAGYDCKKVIITDSTGNEMIMYVTDQIKPKNDKNKYGNGKVKGFPLQIEVETSQMTMVMTASSVEKKVDKKVFKTDIPDGYEEMSGEDLQKMLGGM